VTLSDLPLQANAVVETVHDTHANDAISRRLRELGFVKGESVRLVARGPIGGEPLLVQVGFTRFALRRSEAARIQITAEQGASA
jgi:ferrous iron transport protein A